jgi:hypothetical protein
MNDAYQKALDRLLHDLRVETGRVPVEVRQGWCRV